MAFSTFVFDTLDVCTRLGRYILQELLGWQGPRRGDGGHRAHVLRAAGLLLVADAGSYRSVLDPVRHLQPAARRAVAAGDHGVAAPVRAEASPWRWCPALFVLAVTLTALVLQLGQAFAAGASWIARWNGLVSAALLGLAGLLLITTAREVRRRIPGHPAASPAAPS